jgi:hypothetical protein
MMATMFMILIAVHEQEREREVPSNAPNEQRDPIAPDLPAAESGPRGRDPEGEDIGMIAKY